MKFVNPYNTRNYNFKKKRTPKFGFHLIGFHLGVFFMTNEELLAILLRQQDHRIKYRMRTRKPFILFIKNKNFPKKIFYVRYTEDRIVLSTGETELSKAEKFALEHLESHTPDAIKAFNKKDEFHSYLLEYYKENSPHIEYCNQHNRKVSDTDRYRMESQMKLICELTPDVHKFKEITKQRLIQLQNDLLNTEGKRGLLSVKTVKNYFVNFERTFKELLDKDIIEHNPFSDLPPLKSEIGQAWDCFPITPFKKILVQPFYSATNFKEIFYSLLGYIAIMTGQRKSEIELLNSDSIMKRKTNGETLYWLYVDGSKTDNANRTIPITQLTAAFIELFVKLKDKELLYSFDSYTYFQECLNYYGKFCGYDTIEKIKNGNNGKSRIVFHGYRKMYKTILTQENVNKDLIEYCIGHKSKIAILRNRYSNVNDTYLVLEKSDNTTANKVISKALSYFEPDDIQLKRALWYLKGFTIGIEAELDFERCVLIANKCTNDAVQEHYEKIYGNNFWGGERLSDEQKNNPEAKKLLSELLSL